ncbi:MAG: HD-GYP domain-containing protein [Lachnospiraceae bacterium]|nr:HD-GYP domain-containing protein [Lachnospiraceae bacterium]MBQ9609397.1 HD-GYP domain-containing protein [Lachnospiraceae bacterium]
MIFLKHYQTDMMLVLIGALGLVTILIILTKTLSKSKRRDLLFMSLCSMLILLADIEAYRYRGNESVAGFWMVRICNFLLFFLLLLYIYAFNMYIMDALFDEEKNKKIPLGLIVSKIIILIGALLVIISQFTGLYYTFDEHNRYQRSQGFVIGYIFPIAVLIIQLFTIVKHRKALSRGIYISLLIFTIMPLLASVAQAFAYGLSLINMTMVWMVIILYFFAVVDMNKKVEQARKLEMDYLIKEKGQLREFLKQVSLAFAKTIDMKDEYTNGHSFRVAKYTAELSKELGYDADTVERFAYVALLHDIGKIGIPDEILNKPEQLTDEEFGIIKSHTTLGYNVLKDISMIPEIADGAGYHHERPDGKGYPNGLKEDEIPRVAQIIAVADTFDAMYSDRKYRKRMNFEKAVSIIKEGSGTQLKADVVDAFLRLVDKGMLKAPDDDGEGSMTEINNIKE